MLLSCSGQIAAQEIQVNVILLPFAVFFLGGGVDSKTLRLSKVRFCGEQSSSPTGWHSDIPLCGGALNPLATSQMPTQTW